MSLAVRAHMMFTFHRPTDPAIRRFLARQQQMPHSYVEVSATKVVLPHGYDVDHNRIQLGTGRAVFDRAKVALQRWEMFNLGWTHLCWPTAPIEVGTPVVVLAHVFGLWVLNACRIVYVLDDTGPIEIFGFAYGTLPGHVERGEERFTVQWNHTDDSVWYDLLAFSRPNHILTRLGYLYVRHLQKRFARDSRQAMLRATRS